MMHAVIPVREFFCLHKKFLVYNLVSKNLKVKYRRSFLGVFWTVLAPLMTALIYYVVFSVILKVQRPDYMLLVLSGVMAWNYFSQTVSEGVTHYIEAQNLISKIYLPIQAFNFTTATTNLITLLFTVPIVSVIAVVQGKALYSTIWLLPLFIACLFLMAYSGSIIVAVLYVFFRDLRQAIGLLFQLLFYATPILYTIDMVPEQYRWVLDLNPVGNLIPAIQNCFTGGRPWTLELILFPVIWALGFSLVAAVVLRQARRSVVENL
jgi:lipopolysaccharide transport system permease protein